MNKHLIKAVTKQLGYHSVNEECLQTLKDISNHGIDGGYGKFIYHSDTIEFFDNNRTEILEMAANLASDLGGDMLTMIAGFNCLKDSKLTATNIMSGIWEKGSEYETEVKNALAWFAGEEVARAIVDN